MGENEEEKNLNAENAERVHENVSSKEETKVQENIPTNEETKTQEFNNQEPKSIAQNLEKKESKTEQKEESNFKKVETKTKKSKHGVAKAIVILIGLIVLAYLIFVMRNYFIIRDIKTKASEYKDITNYTYKSKTEELEITVTKKDNITRIDLNRFAEEDRNTIIWYNEEDKESIISFPEQKKARITNFSDVTASAPFLYANDDMYLGVESDGRILYTWIYTDEFNGKECYVICSSKNDKEWIEKDTGIVVKRESGDLGTSEITDIEVNTVKEVYKPDLTGYEITENN